MSEELLEVVLVGGSKDGTIAEGSADTRAINNIVLNDTKDSPEFIDLYMPTNVTDKEGRPIYAHIGRYDATESASYWATLSQEERDALKQAAEEAEKSAEAEKPAEEEEAAESAVEEVTDENESTEESSEEDGANASADESDEGASDDEAAGEQANAGTADDDAGSNQESDGTATDEVVEVEADSEESQD